MRPVIVVGAGAAGMMAGLRAADLGRDVTLLEKSVEGGCNAERGGGQVQAAGSRFQQAAGVRDSAELMFADIMAKNEGDADPEIVRRICARSADVVHFLVDAGGVDLHLDTNVRFYGHSTFRMHTSPGESGAEVVASLREAIAASPRITLVDEAGVTGLACEGERVVGVQLGARRLDGAAVVLACDGFAANPEMVRRYCPEIAGAPFVGSPNNTGDGIRWGVAAGAAVDRMGAYQGHCHVNPGARTRLAGSMPNLGSILVNREGRRFAREDQGYSEFARVVRAQPGGVALELFDRRLVDAAWQSAAFRAAYGAGAIHSSESVAALAQRFGVPPDVATVEVADYNAAARGEHADRLGRQELGPPLEPPFFGSLVTGAIAHTQGGLRIDAGARVLREDRSLIPGLYAAGGTAAGISGGGADGYLSGNGLAQAFGTGLIAAETLVASLGAATFN